MLAALSLSRWHASYGTTSEPPEARRRDLVDEGRERGGEECREGEGGRQEVGKGQEGEGQEARCCEGGVGVDQEAGMSGTGS